MIGLGTVINTAGIVLGGTGSLFTYIEYCYFYIKKS